MKWLFLLLLIFNIGVFYWGYQQERVFHGNPEVVSALAVPRLVLLAERSTGPAEGSALPRKLQDTSINEDQPVTEEINESDRPESAESGAISLEPSEIAPPDVVDQTVNSPPQNEVGETIPPVPMVSETVQAQGESAPREAAAGYSTSQQGATTELPALVESVAEPPTVTTCVAIGPWDSTDQARSVEASLTDMEVSMKVENYEKRIGYWVLIPPMNSVADARAMMKKLGDAGFTDVWRFTKGKLSNAISMGLFHSKNFAERRSEAIATQGIQTEVQPRFVDGKRYWLQLKATREPLPSDQIWERISSKYTDVTRSTIDCSQIVSP